MDAKSAGRIPGLGKREGKNLHHPKTQKDHRPVECVVAAAGAEVVGVVAAVAEGRMSLQMVVAVEGDEGKRSPPFDPLDAGVGQVAVSHLLLAQAMRGLHTACQACIDCPSVLL
jgi:hypothetical protein